jgi:ADP-heptose:LPS heptosyltransferase
VIKAILNFLMKAGVALYVRLNTVKIERIEAGWRAPEDLSSILIFSTTALGDTLLSTPAIASLAKSFPNAKLTLFLHRNLVPLFAGIAEVHAVVTYYGGFKRFVRTALALRRTEPQAALLLHSNGPQDIPLAVLSGARIILKPATTSAYRDYLSYQFAHQARHVIEERLDLARLLGAKELTTRLQLPERYLKPRTGIVRNSLSGARWIVGFQPGAANTFKMWPAQRFAALADKLTQTAADIDIVITGSPKERRLAREIITACTTRRIHDYCGQYSVDELPFLIREFDLLISNDTGPMHLAIALGVPTLCLFGSTSAALIGPYQDLERHRVIQKVGANIAGVPKKLRSNDAMKMISVDEVLQAAHEMLGREKDVGTFGRAR